MLSKEEIERRIAAGAAIRQARAEKRAAMAKEKEKENILAQSLVAVDAYHKGLKQQLKEALNHLHAVLYKNEQLEVKRIPEIADLFTFANEMDMRVAFKMCGDDYRRLISYCWHFQRGKTAVLSTTAFTFWNKILEFPEVFASGSLILAILTEGLINEQLLEILKTHRQKFLYSGMGIAVSNACKRMLKDGGMTHVITGEVKIWSPSQQEVLSQIISLYETRDLRILEELAEDSAELD